MCFKVCILLLVASSAFASQICAPDQFEATVRGITAFTTGTQTGLVRESVDYYYDNTNSRLAIYNSKEKAGVTTKGLILILYSGKTRTQYTVDLETKTCVASPLSGSSGKFCFPDDASYVGQGDLGPAGTLPVLFYTAKVGIQTYEYQITKHGNDYLPVNVARYVNVNGGYFFTVSSYYNLKTGITNTSVFDIPEECKKTNMPQKRSASLFGF